jgi:hypothetical protein
MDRSLGSIDPGSLTDALSMMWIHGGRASLAGSPACAWMGGFLASLAVVFTSGCTQSSRSPDETSGSQAAPPAAAFPLRADPAVGAEIRNRVAAAPREPFDYDLPTITGSGCGMADLDGDGRLDLVLVSLSSQDDTAHGDLTILWQNASGEFADDITRLPLPGIGMGITIGDLTNDGQPDLLATCVGHDAVYLNTGNRSFREVGREAGYSNPSWGTAASLVDLDRDGWLDIVVTNYVDYVARPCRSTGGGPPDFCSPHLFEGTIDRVFFNTTAARGDGQLQLEDRTASAGLAGMQGAGLGLVTADLTGDGLIDLYVANDQMTNSLWVNQGDGQFQDEAILRGCGYDRQGRAQASMGVALADVDADGLFDLFLTHLAGEYHTLYRGQPNGVFEDATVAIDLAAATQGFTGFGVAACDLDLDGDDDLVVANGRVRRPEGMPPGPDDDPLSPYRQPLQFFRNTGGRFEEAACGSPELCEPMVARGLATGDLDDDGDLDLVINRTGAPPLVIRNEASDGETHWLRVRATLPEHGGRDAIGAEVTVVTGDRKIRRMVLPSLGYLSASDPRVHVGLGSETVYDAIEVVWPDGSRTTHPGGRSNREVVLTPRAADTEATP